MEALESVSPLLVWRKELAQDSGGAGKFRGGLGQDVEIEVRSDQPVRLSVMSDRHKYPPRGILGGRDGSHTRIEFRDGTRPHQKGRTLMQPGELLRLHFPGGGGFGDPAERDPAAIEDDIAKGYVSAEAARFVYGYKA